MDWFYVREEYRSFDKYNSLTYIYFPIYLLLSSSIDISNPICSLSTLIFFLFCLGKFIACTCMSMDGSQWKNSGASSGNNKPMSRARDLDHAMLFGRWDQLLYMDQHFSISCLHDSWWQRRVSLCVHWQVSYLTQGKSSWCADKEI